MPLPTWMEPPQSATLPVLRSLNDAMGTALNNNDKQLFWQLNAVFQQVLKIHHRKVR